VGLDEEGILARLRSLRREVIDPAIAAAASCSPAVRRAMGGAPYPAAEAVGAGA
jgi:hypothetical protein